MYIENNIVKKFQACPHNLKGIRNTYVSVIWCRKKKIKKVGALRSQKISEPLLFAMKIMSQPHRKSL